MQNDLVRKAEAFARAAHDAIGHRRKYEDEPYTVHLERVAGWMAARGGDDAMVAAAWLHDTVEDTPTRLEDIERAFGDDVVRLVEALTDVPQSAGNRAQRKALDRARLAAAGARAQSVKLGDLIDNAGDICAHDPQFARVYLREAEALLPVMHEAPAALREEARAVLRECEAILRRKS